MEEVMRKPDGSTLDNVAAKEYKKESFQNLFLSLPDPTSIMTPEGVRIDTNYAAERLFKRSRDEIIGARLEELYVREDAANIRHALERSKHDGFESCEVTCLRGDDTTFPAILSFAPVRDQEGNVINVLMSATDITDLKQKNEELKETLEGLATPVWLFDKEGSVTYVNSSFGQVLGYKEEECIGNSLEEFCAKTVNERDAPTAANRVKERLLSGEITRNVPLTFITKEKKEIPMLYHAAPMKDIKGNITGEVVSATDITELRRREEELAEAKAYSEGIILSVADALAVVDNEGKFLTANPAMTKLAGYNEEELLGKRTSDQPFCQLPEAREVLRDMWRRVEAGEIVSGIEMPWVKKDGIKVIVSCSEQALKDDKGNVIGRVFIARDVTELKKAAHEIAQALGALSEGDLTSKVEVSGLTGDLRGMGENINQSLDNLSILIQKMREGVRMVSQTAQSLGASTEELNASTQQISSSTSQMAQGAEDQARQIQEMKKVASTLKESSQRNASEAELVAKKSAQVTEVAQAGSGAAKDAIARTANILDVTSQSAAAVKGLGELTEEIGMIVGVITNIADQTNLLSLNAAIEAARAGEQGRAFAVVAEEVKKLAGESRGSAGKIANTVKRIESERAKTIASMDSTLKEVSEGREVVTKSLNALVEIAQMVHETADMSQNILSLNREQEGSTQKITQAVDEIGTIASDNAAAAEEISASTEEQTASMESLSAAAQELSGMAENVHGEVDKFRVDDRGGK